MASESTTTIPGFAREEELTAWLFGIIRPCIKGRTLLIEGMKDTSLNNHLINQNLPFHISNSDKNRFLRLQEKYSSSDQIRFVHNLDFDNGDFINAYSYLSSAFRTVIVFNIFEPNKGSRLWNPNLAFIIQPRGCLIKIELTPISLFNIESIDWADAKKEIVNAIKRDLGWQFELLKVGYFNLDMSALGGFEGLTNPYVLIIAKRM
jgi:hypothetical protein